MHRSPNSKSTRSFSVVLSFSRISITIWQNAVCPENVWMWHWKDQNRAKDLNSFITYFLRNKQRNFKIQLFVFWGSFFWELTLVNQYKIHSGDTTLLNISNHSVSFKSCDVLGIITRHRKRFWMDLSNQFHKLSHEIWPIKWLLVMDNS